MEACFLCKRQPDQGISKLGFETKVGREALILSGILTDRAGREATLCKNCLANLLEHFAKSLRGIKATEIQMH